MAKAKIKTAAAKAAEHTHPKEQILNSQRYVMYRDCLGALLDDNERYTLNEVDAAIEYFMKGEVK